MKRLCTICARGGSKGLPGKNLRILAGKPLIAHSVSQALASGLFTDVAVSSDTDEILRAGEAAGATRLVVRPANLASDTAPKLPAIQHCVAEVEQGTGERYDTIVDLQPTSPLRDVADIIGATNLLESTPADNVITGSPAHKNPYFDLIEEFEDGRLLPAKQLKRAIARRQDAPRCYDMNGSIYVWTRAALMSSDVLFRESTKLYLMPRERSVDIDDELEFLIVECLMMQLQRGMPA